MNFTKFNKKIIFKKFLFFVFFIFEFLKTFSPEKLNICIIFLKKMNRKNTNFQFFRKMIFYKKVSKFFTIILAIFKSLLYSTIL